MIARIHPLAPLLPLGLLVGCASAPVAVKDPAPAGQVVVGTGTASDRAEINADDQRIYNAEHAESADTSAAPAGPNQGIP